GAARQLHQHVLGGRGGAVTEFDEMTQTGGKSAFADRVVLHPVVLGDVPTVEQASDDHRSPDVAGFEPDQHLVVDLRQEGHSSLAPAAYGDHPGPGALDLTERAELDLDLAGLTVASRPEGGDQADHHSVPSEARGDGAALEGVHQAVRGAITGGE